MKTAMPLQSHKAIKGDIAGKKGQLLQENGYYPFGLEMKAISSQAAMKQQTRYKFNAGTELEDNFDVDYYETFYRNYDPQIGRFTGVDLLAELTPDFTPYHFAANNPVYWNDPTGGLFFILFDPNYWFGPVMPLQDVVVTTSTNSGGGGGINFGTWNGILDQFGGLNFGGGMPGGNSGNTTGSGGGFNYTGGGGGNGSGSRRREGTDTRRRWRDDNWRRVTNLSLFDERGRELLGRWLNGSGETLNTKNGVWGEYMKNDKLLNKQILDVLKRDASIRKQSGNVNFQFHADIENGYLTGYEMLHGTVTPLGDFQMNGTAKFINGNTLQYDLTLNWNDIIDPNGTYSDDVTLSKALELLYNPKDYDVHISWDQNFKIILK